MRATHRAVASSILVLASLASAQEARPPVTIGEFLRAQEGADETPDPATAPEARPPPVSIGEWLQTLPQQGNALNTQFNGDGDGSIRVSLRALGTGRTLVLVNGRRVVPLGPWSSAVDLTSIPSQAIERVEILQGGASAAYGPDAIAGVVNLVTRRGLDGASASVYAGTSGQGDGTVHDVNVSAGASGERGNLLFSAGYFTQGSVSTGDRVFSSVDKRYDYRTGRWTPLASSATPAGRFRLDPATCATPACLALATEFGTGARDFVVDPAAANGFRPYVGPDASGNLNDAYNYQPGYYLSTPQERVSAFAIGHTPLGGGARAYFEASYVNRQSSVRLAPEPLFTITGGLAVDPGSSFNPFGVALPDVRRRLVEFGHREREQTVDTFRVVTGLDGALPESFGPAAGWFWDLSLHHGRAAGIEVTRGTLRAPLVGAAIGPSFEDPTDGVVKCGTPGAIVPGCTPLDLLGGAGSITQDQVLGLGFEGADRVTSELTQVAFLATGDLFTLPGGPAGLAVGYELRTLSGSSIPNPISAAGESSGNNFRPTNGSTDASEVHGELSLPFLADLPGARRFEVSLAARLADHSTFGSALAHKAGALWQPIPDVKVRGTYSSDFREPSIHELFEPRGFYTPTVIDPCAGSSLGPGTPGYIDPSSPLGVACGSAVNNGDDRSMLWTWIGGSAGLDPETSRSLGLGLTLEPRWVKGLVATVDYHSVDLEGLVSSLGPGLILTRCFLGGGQYCGRITRDPITGYITAIDGTLANAGGARTSSIDWSARYDLATSVGRFRFTLDGTYLREFVQELPDGTTYDAAGTYDLLFAAPRWKVNAGVGWAWKAFAAGLFNRYVGAFDECANSAGTDGPDGLCWVDQTASLGVPRIARKVEAWSQLDAFVGWGAPSPLGRTRLTLGVRNALDASPRVVFNGALATSDAATYDYVGRFFFARLEVSR